jgi:4-hydroxy-3-polyprenylbenzoate decarboxylase
MRRLIVGLSGSTGAVFGIRLLEALKQRDVESHLSVSNWAESAIRRRSIDCA